MAIETTPLIDGYGLSWRSIQVINGPEQMPGIRMIGFKCIKEAEEQYGAGSIPLEINPGNVRFEGSLTLLAKYKQDFCDRLAPNGGWMDTKFGLTALAEEGLHVYRARLVGCVMLEEGHDFQQGQMGLEVVIPLKMNYYLINGKPPVKGLKLV